jgi:hypothetical protein
MGKDPDLTFSEGHPTQLPAGCRFVLAPAENKRPVTILSGVVNGLNPAGRDDFSNPKGTHAHRAT